MREIVESIFMVDANARQLTRQYYFEKAKRVLPDLLLELYHGAGRFDNASDIPKLTDTFIREIFGND